MRDRFGNFFGFLLFLIRSPVAILAALLFGLVYYYSIACWLRIDTHVAFVEIAGFSPGEKVLLERLWFQKHEAVADVHGVVRINRMQFGQWHIYEAGTESLRDRTIYVREYARMFFPAEVILGPVRVRYVKEPMFRCVIDDLRPPSLPLPPGST